MNLELYINNRLVDIESPEKLGIRLKRVFINPAELNTKDAQKSYEISLPATPANNEIFNHVNVEEVQGKFKIYGDARLYVDGVLILDGKFRLSEITRDYYKGNLGVPAPVTVKDIFGETMMNQAGKWEIPFNGVESITAYNTDGYEKDKYGDISPCIFPLVLYGLLPKYPETSNYSEKDVYDNSVRFLLNDFYPSVNCVHMLKRIFKNADYTLTGNALDDERIKNLYVSYKNSEDYTLFRGTGTMKVEGEWGNLQNGIKESAYEFTFEKYGKNKNIISTNIFNSRNLSPNLKITDSGSNIILTQGNYRKNLSFKVPHSALYKLELDVELQMNDETTESFPGLPSIKSYGLNERKIEIKLVRYGNDTEKLTAEKFDNTFFKNNQPKETDGEGAIYPREGGVNFVDPMQNTNYICGFSWGEEEEFPDHINPASSIRHNPLAIKGGKSWSQNIDDRYFSAVESAGYKQRTGNSFTDVNDFKVELNDIPDSKKTKTTQSSDKRASGHISQVVWLEEGESLSLISTATLLQWAYGLEWPNHSINFTLSVTPFRKDRNWLTVNEYGYSRPDAPMSWNDPANIAENATDLIKYLPADAKVNDWIDNFCKTFNLEMTNTGNNTFALNIKKNNIITHPGMLIDLDRKSSATARTNEPLGLPYLYELGFTADTAEQGYYESMEDEKDPETGQKTGEKIVNSGNSGKGEYHTGSRETSKISQTSNFSYCWYKTIEDKVNGIKRQVPVITDHEVWENDAYDYEEMSQKIYTDKSQRFWYKTNETIPVDVLSGKTAALALVANEYNGQEKLILDYNNIDNSIMKSFFLLLINSDNNYTLVECTLSAQEYALLDKALIKFNGDLYNVAEVDGYDPLGINKSSIKLIRRII